MDLTGKKIKYKGDPDSAAKTVIKVEDDMVYLSDNGRTPLSTINDKFEIMNERLVQPNIQHVQELPLSNFGDLFNRAKNQEPAIIPAKGYNGDEYDYSQLSPETRSIINENLEKQKIAVDSVKNDPWIKNQFSGNKSIRGKDLSQSVVQIDMLDEQYNGDVESQTNNRNIKTVSKLPKLKKIKTVKIKLELTEMIPRLEDIKAVQNLFDDISIIDEIAKEIADKYLHDKELFQGMIIEQLQKMIKGNSPKKKIKPNNERNTSK